jgi:MFS family permease
MRVARIAAVTAGLVATGAVVGATVGVLMISLWLLPGDLAELWTDTDLLLISAMFGAMVGGVFGPVAAWLLMRHVPLWRAVGGTALGTLAASVLGLLVGGWEMSFNAALLGFGASAVYLCARTPRENRRIGAPADHGLLHE